MATPDVTIMGAGIFGLSCAWELARRGACVQVIDPHGVGAGSSGGLVGALSPHVPENWNAKKQFQLESLLMMEGWWAEVEAASGVDTGYARRGRLQPLNDDLDVARATARAAEAAVLWKSMAEWCVVPVPTGAWTVASETGMAVFDNLTGRIAPRKALAALAGALKAKSVEVLPTGKQGAVTLWATGLDGLERLSRDLGREVGSGVKGQAALLRFSATAEPQLFIDGMHIVPHADGTVAVGSTSERLYTSPNGTDAKLQDLVEKARAHVPALAQADVIDRWAGVRPRAASRAPMMGHWPGRPDHYVANGGFKIGFGIAPKVAATMAALILDGRDSVPQGFRVEDNV